MITMVQERHLYLQTVYKVRTWFLFIGVNEIPVSALSVKFPSKSTFSGALPTNLKLLLRESNKFYWTHPIYLPILHSTGRNSQKGEKSSKPSWKRNNFYFCLLGTDGVTKMDEFSEKFPGPSLSCLCTFIDVERWFFILERFSCGGRLFP